MAQVINTNSLSLLTQNNLNKSQSSLSSAIERLSSGLRINSAKDDAAGQAIANRFSANIRGLTQASRNANDGISIAQTTEGALFEINNNLQRVRELSVQATNGTNSQSDLDSIQNEITQRLGEIDRVSGQTQFNGVKVLSQDSSLKIQVGANDGETITIDLKEITSDTLGLKSFNINGKGSVANTAASGKDMISDGFAASGTIATDGKITYTKDIDNKAASQADLFRNLQHGDSITNYVGIDTGLGVKADSYIYDKASNSFKFTTDSSVESADALNYLNPNAGDTTKATVTIGAKSQVVIIDKAGALKTEDGKDLLIDSAGNLTQTGSGTTVPATLDRLQINVSGSTTPVSVSIKTENGVVLSTDGGADKKFKVADASISADKMQSVLDKGTSKFDINLNGTTYNYDATAAVSADKIKQGGNTVQLDKKGALTTDKKTTETYYEFENGNISDGTGSVAYKDASGKISIESATKSDKTKDPLKALDSALAKVDALRSDLGAVQNRFDSTITNLGNTVNNLSSARSRIEDADYATEVSNMSRAQILQQAGTSVLAQANQVTQNVLSLLR